jgi:UDP-2-acetamido-2,6-beta-L-arabino-hexul-4-ose reductase
MKVVVEELTVHHDARGAVFEPLTSMALAAQRNVHVVVTEPGHIRGNHYHTRSTEVVTLYGPALVRLKECGRLRDLQVPEGRALRLVIPPGVAHAFQNTGNFANVLIGFSTQEYDRENPDVVSELLIADKA